MRVIRDQAAVRGQKTEWMIIMMMIIHDIYYNVSRALSPETKIKQMHMLLLHSTLIRGPVRRISPFGGYSVVGWFFRHDQWPDLDQVALGRGKRSVRDGQGHGPGNVQQDRTSLRKKTQVDVWLYFMSCVIPHMIVYVVKGFSPAPASYNSRPDSTVLSRALKPCLESSTPRPSSRLSSSRLPSMVGWVELCNKRLVCRIQSVMMLFSKSFQNSSPLNIFYCCNNISQIASYLI